MSLFCKMRQGYLKGFFATCGGEKERVVRGRLAAPLTPVFPDFSMTLKMRYTF
jgi:hypothetical protein